MPSRTLDPEDAAMLLFDQGYAVFERAFDPAQVHSLRQEVEDLYLSLGSPPCYADDLRILGPAVHVGKPGLIVAKLVERRPSLGGRILDESVVDTMRRLLGDDMYLELTATVIADETREFFAWHNHIGGQDDGAYRATGAWPDIARPRRIGTLLYLDELDDDNGPLLVYPRAAGAPTAPPHDLDGEDWAGQVVVRAPAGSVVAMDECVWHAARRKRTRGLRILIGCNFVSRTAPRAPLVEYSLRSNAYADDLLRSVLPPEEVR